MRNSTRRSTARIAAAFLPVADFRATIDSRNRRHAPGRLTAMFARMDQYTGQIASAHPDMVKHIEEIMTTGRTHNPEWQIFTPEETENRRVQ